MSTGVGSVCGGESVALLQRIHLQRVHGIHDVLELVGELRVVLQVEAAGQHEVDGIVKVVLRGVQVAARLVGHAALIRVLHQRNELLVLAVLGGGQPLAAAWDGLGVERPAEAACTARAGAVACGCVTAAIEQAEDHSQPATERPSTIRRLRS